MKASNLRACVLDEQEIAARLGSDRELLRELCEIFERESIKLIAQIEDNIKRGDADGVCRAAHALKGSAINFGRTPCVETALLIEDAARAGKIDVAIEMSPLLKEELNQLLAGLSEFERT